jgi:hypothetical protein
MHGIPVSDGRWCVVSDTAKQLKMTQQVDGVVCCTLELG